MAPSCKALNRLSNCSLIDGLRFHELGPRPNTEASPLHLLHAVKAAS